MTIHEAADIIQNPKEYWSHEKDDAKSLATQLLVVIDKGIEHKSDLNNVISMFMSGLKNKNTI